jgi:RNA polymerase sporulation-specific sigma factor
MIREGNEEALSFMFEKYKPLIYKKIMKFNLVYDFDDMVQEAMMILYKSVLKFEDNMNKSFTMFFDLNLNRKYISIVSKRVRRQEIFEQNKFYIHETVSMSSQNDVYLDVYLDEIAKVLTKTENLVYTLRELNNYSVQFIKDNYNLGEKVIYNTLYRAKGKINKHFRN